MSLWPPPLGFSSTSRIHCVTKPNKVYHQQMESPCHFEGAYECIFVYRKLWLQCIRLCSMDSLCQQAKQSLSSADGRNGSSNHMTMSFVHKRLLQAERASRVYWSAHISFRCTFSELKHTSVNATILSHHVLVPCALELRVILFQMTSIRCTFRELKHISVNKRSYPNQVVVPCAPQLRVILLQMVSFRCTFRELKHTSVNAAISNHVVVPCAPELRVWMQVIS